MNHKTIKIITICGSLKFKNEMLKIAEKTELAGNVVLMPILPANDDKDAYTEEEISILGKMHREKIKLSNAILVVNVDNYIGNSTKNEIEFAEALSKEVVYYSDLRKT